MIKVSQHHLLIVKSLVILVSWVIILFPFDHSDNSTTQHLLGKEIGSVLPLVDDIFSTKVEGNRPILPDSLLSSNQHFMIHYTTNGKDAVSSQDSNLNFIPDRIEKIADAFERSYQVEIEQLGYKLPLSSKDGTKPYGIYVVDLNNSYGITVKEGIDSTVWEAKNASSYISFDNDFIGPGYHIQGDDAIKTTAAHEFFHAIQLGYVFRKLDGFFFELSAVWMEDQVFDEIDNYLYYLNYFFSAPEIPLNGVAYTVPNIVKHIYGSCIFCFYMAENFGVAAIRDIWERMPDQTALEAVNSIFSQHGKKFESEFINFSLWNFFTGIRARTDYSYRNGAIFPEVAVRKDTLIDYYSQQFGQGYFLSAGYYLFHPVATGTYHVLLSTDKEDHWRLGIVVYDENSIKINIARPYENVEITNVLKGQNILVVPCNIDRFTNPTSTYFKDKPESYNFILNKEVPDVSPPLKPYEISLVCPNPSSNTIVFIVKKFKDISLWLKIFNIHGQQIDQLFFDRLSSEVNPIVWNAAARNSNLTSGIYFCQFSAANVVEMKKIIIYR